ncbi:hypothetical protein AURDEDRAFT_178553, partial [Auricularia subglabra TFB-10046 SS5]
MPSAKGSGPPPPPSAMGKTGSLKSRFSFGRPASISLSEASILSLSVGPTPSPQPAPEPVPVPVKVPPARPSEDTVVAIERKNEPRPPHAVLARPRLDPVPGLVRRALRPPP